MSKGNAHLFTGPSFDLIMFQYAKTG